jgi:hypothetical protein
MGSRRCRVRGPPRRGSVGLGRAVSGGSPSPDELRWPRPALRLWAPVRQLEEAFEQERKAREHAESELSLMRYTADLERRLKPAAVRGAWVLWWTPPDSDEPIQFPGDDPAKHLVALVMTWLANPKAMTMRLESKDADREAATA